jgi:Asp-tRNA(Asn)/Glu-tRNA(Gln) amidotransferase A subunit family amidase
MFDFRRESVDDLAASVATKDIAARELVQAALDRIDAVDGKVGAFVAVDAERALAEATAIDERIARGDTVGPLAGIPIGVKDLEDALGFRTTYGSRMHADDALANEDSPLVARLRAAGCLVIGKTNTPEHGSRPVTENGLFPPSRNPWDLDRSAGGSSGGSAAAVAAGMVPLATGSDGGGSIRIPSAVCGLTGMKPSLGRVPSGGPRPPGWLDLSTKGVMGRTFADVVAGLGVAVGPDPTDLRSLPPPEVSWARSIDDVNVPHRIGWAPTLGYATIDREVLAACERGVAALADLGAEVVEIDTVFEDDPIFDWLAIAGTANERTIGHLRGTPEWELVDSEMRLFADIATSRVRAVDLVRAFDAMHTLNLRLVEIFHRVPLLLTPTVAGQTPVVGTGQGTINGKPTPAWVSMTYAFNLTRSPAGTVCTGFTDDGMPVGLQVIGPQHADVAVLRLLSVLESALGLDTIAPLP